ncbi:MAG: DHHW family protein [Acutalibacteraceae bacterium]
MKKKKRKALLSAVFLIFVFSLAVLFFVLPKAERSQNEKRVLAGKPKLSLSAVADGTFSKELDDYLADHFPFRDVFVGVNSYAKLALGENGSSGIYKCSDGYLIAQQSDFDMKKAESNMKNMLSFSESTGLPTTFMIVPSSGYIMDNVLPRFHKPYRDDEVISMAKELCKNADFIDLRQTFRENRDSVQLYYKTDHHLTSRGSKLMYDEFCEAKKLPKAEFTLSKTVDGFYGTAYSKSGLWLTKGDSVEIWKSGNTSHEVIIEEKDGAKKSESLYFEDHLNDMDKYPVFLDGNHALVTVRNKNCRNGKRLLLIKDSFAHCFATFLTENYEEICMVDMRYYRDNLRQLIKSESLNEILYLYGTENAATSTDIAWLAMM